MIKEKQKPLNHDCNNSFPCSLVSLLASSCAIAESNPNSDRRFCHCCVNLKRKNKWESSLFFLKKKKKESSHSRVNKINLFIYVGVSFVPTKTTGIGRLRVPCVASALDTVINLLIVRYNMMTWEKKQLNFLSQLWRCRDLHEGS